MKCSFCSRPDCSNTLHQRIDGIGNTKAKYVFVFDCPQTAGAEPASGRDRKMFFEVLSEAGISVEDVFITYAYRFWPGTTRGKLNSVGISMYRRFQKMLTEELDFINPDIVFTMGADATKWVMNDNNIKFAEVRGSFVHRIHKLYPIYNLRQIYYDPSIKSTVVADIKRAINPQISLGADWGIGVSIAPNDVQLDALFQQAVRVGVVASDVETTGIEWWREDFQVTHYGAYWGDNRGVVFDPRKHREYYEKFLTLRQRVYNSPYEGNVYPKTSSQGLAVREKIMDDGMILCYLLNPVDAQRSIGLEAMARTYLGATNFKGREGNDWQKWAERNAIDVQITWDLVGLAKERLNDKQLRLYREIILPSAMILGGLKERKIYIDHEHQRQMKLKLSKLMKGIQEELELVYSFPMGGNPNSSDQCKDYLYRKRGIPMTKIRGADGKMYDNDSTDADVLCQLALSHPEADLIRAYRKAKKVESNYLYDTPYIRPDIRPCGTVSGRTAGKDGIQTHPRPNKRYLPDIIVRDSFLPERGMWVGGDLSQIELVLMSIKSQDPVMMEIYKSGGDIHNETCKGVFGVEPTGHKDCECKDCKWHSENRYKAKPINFLTLYGGKAGMLRMTALKEYGVMFSYPEAHTYREKFLDRYQGLANFHFTRAQEAIRQGYIDSPLGQRYFIPGIHSSDANKQRQAINYALNWDNQGDGHYLNMLGLLAAFELDPGAPTITIHDFVGNSVAEHDAAEFSVAWKEAWQRKIDEYYPLEERYGVPIKMDVKIGKTLAKV